MHYEFSILDIYTTLHDKTVRILTTMDIQDRDIVIELYEKKSREAVSFDSSVNGEELIVKFRDFPKVNTEYMITVTGLKSITDETLNHPVTRRLYFKSGIVSKAEIISPAFFEQVEEVNVIIKEITTNDIGLDTSESDDGILGNDETVGSYYIEIATDNAFINKVAETMFEKESIRISLAEAGQYYMRARVQKHVEHEVRRELVGDIEYGNWGDIRTFTYKHIPLPNGDSFNEEDFIPDIENTLEPVIDLDELKLIGFPEQGVTGESFIFEFNKPIDNLNIGDIFIIRKGIK